MITTAEGFVFNKKQSSRALFSGEAANSRRLEQNTIPKDQPPAPTRHYPNWTV